jgi:hypothetical protein
MTDQLPSPEALRRICLLALAFIGACRRLKDVNDRLRASAGAVVDHPGAFKAWHAARDLLDRFLSESGGKAPLGWPPAVERTLRKITSAIEWDADFLFRWPPEIPELEAEIESLVAVATDVALAAAPDVASGKDPKELAKAGLVRATSGALSKRGISKRRLKDMARRALEEGIIIDYEFDRGEKLWVRWKNP